MSNIDKALEVIMPIAKILNITENEAREALNIVQEYYAAKAKQVVKPVYKIIGSTYVVELDPLQLKLIVNQTSGNDLTLNNAMNACFVGHQLNNKAYPISMLISEGNIIHNAQPNGYWSGLLKGKGIKTPTFIIFKNGIVTMTNTNDLSSEAERIQMAVSGVGCYPKVTGQGYIGYVPWSSVARATNRIGIGYRAKDNKVLLVYRPNTSVARLHDTFANLECDFGISLDSGNSANLRVKGSDIITTNRQMYAWITW